MAHRFAVLRRSTQRLIGTCHEVVMRLFCKSPDMSDSDYKDLHDRVSGWHLSQLATAIFSSLPPAMGQLIVSQLPDSLASDGLDILRAECRPHYGPT